MVADDMNLFVLQHILGHSDPKQTSRYNNPSDDMRLEAMVQLEERRVAKAQIKAAMTITGRSELEAERQVKIDANRELILQLAKD